MCYFLNSKVIQLYTYIFFFIMVYHRIYVIYIHYIFIMIYLVHYSLWFI